VIVRNDRHAGVVREFVQVRGLLTCAFEALADCEEGDVSAAASETLEIAGDMLIRLQAHVDRLVMDLVRGTPKAEPVTVEPTGDGMVTLTLPLGELRRLRAFLEICRGSGSLLARVFSVEAEGEDDGEEAAEQ